MAIGPPQYRDGRDTATTCERHDARPPRRRTNQTLLPSRLTRCSRRAAIIFIRESATAPASTAATRTAAPAAAARAASAAFGLRARFVHFQIAAAEIFAVERGDRLCGFVIVRHFNES